MSLHLRKHRLQQSNVRRANRVPDQSIRATRAAAARNPGKDRTGVGRRAGSRLASTLGVSVGRSTLLRLVRALPDPPTGVETVLGIDDFALWRGHRYAGCSDRYGYAPPMSMFPPIAQSAPSLNGCEHIPVPRSSAATAPAPMEEAARAGAPDAIEVADRWHLLHNLAEAVEKTVAAHHHCLKEESELEPEPSIERTASEQLRIVAEQVHATRQESSILAVRTKRRFEAITTLKNEGIGIDAIARQFGLARETVCRFYYANSVDELLGAPGAGKPTTLDKFAVHLHERFGRRVYLRCCTVRRTSSIGISRQLQLRPRLLETPAHYRRCAGQKTNSEGPADHLLDVATPRQPHRFAVLIPIIGKRCQRIHAS